MLRRFEKGLASFKLSLGRLKHFWHKYKKNRAAILGIIITIIFIIIASFAPLISPYDPYMMSMDILTPPSWKHFMGTDDLGRDIFSQVLYGAQVSLMVGIIASMLSAITGVLFGAISGYLGGYADEVLMRIGETFQIIPRFFLALLFVALFGSSLWNIIVVIGILGWPVVARIVRIEFLSLKESQFVEAARASGESGLRIVFFEILPNAIPSVIVVVSLQVAWAILIEAGLGFLGLSDPALFSWGRTLNNATAIMRVGWWVGLFPGLAIFLTILGLNLVGDGLNDALNPRLKER